MLTILCCFFLVHLPIMVQGHGRVIEPPARNMMWRFGYNTPPNYEDTELFCGGIKVQWQENNGSCGVCGDRYDSPKPRRHETGGFFSKNIITRTYREGQDIDIIVELVANHLGTFTFAVCPIGEDMPVETEECFDKHVLRLSDGSGTEYQIPHNNSGVFFIRAKLPQITCDTCVLRWHWRSANNWGKCEDGKNRQGCGPQETYRNCIDIAIRNGAGIRGPILYTSEQDLNELPRASA